MPRKPSDATALRQSRSELARLKYTLISVQAQRESYRQRATVAEQAVAEWKTRFDLLLRRAATIALEGEP